jgi:hypothetical protein
MIGNPRQMHLFAVDNTADQRRQRVQVLLGYNCEQESIASAHCVNDA